MQWAHLETWITLEYTGHLDGDTNLLHWEKWSSLCCVLIANSSWTVFLPEMILFFPVLHVGRRKGSSMSLIPIASWGPKDSGWGSCGALYLNSKGFWVRQLVCIVIEHKGFWVRLLTNFAFAHYIRAQRLLGKAVNKLCSCSCAKASGWSPWWAVLLSVLGGLLRTPGLQAQGGCCFRGKVGKRSTCLKF